MTDDAVRWRGVNHLALVTTDMDATVRFWHEVLDARLVTTLATPAFRHYFFEIGEGDTVAFFEYRGVEMETFAKPAGVPYPQASQFDHLSMDLADEDALIRLRNRLKEHGCEVTDVVDHGFIRSIYFNDPNGIALEATYWTLDPTGRPADYTDERLFADPDPVPAVHELREHGRVLSVPATKLVDEITRDLYKTPAP
ncbi:MAG TPA: VOC family protein [Acidimicrobiales bacterium]|nr:VOC family protein [Acidimicrobiales bacterium]